MTTEIELRSVPARRTLVVPTATTWQAFPAVWGGLLDEVWACLRAAGLRSGCPNMMLYRDDVPTVEVGVLCDTPVPLAGRVTVSELPASEAAVTVHRGPFSDVGSTHEAVLGWCAEYGLLPTRMRWEVYGPHDDAARQRVEVGWVVVRQR